MLFVALTRKQFW